MAMNSIQSRNRKVDARPANASGAVNPQERRRLNAAARGEKNATLRNQRVSSNDRLRTVQCVTFGQLAVKRFHLAALTVLMPRPVTIEKETKTFPGGICRAMTPAK